jgi:hypothetical protein
MKVAVWDTYVKRKDGKTMHFDILVPQELKNEQKIYEYGRLYLAGKDVLSEELSTKECNYCHIEEASEIIVKDIKEKGFHIVELKNCI